MKKTILLIAITWVQISFTQIIYNTSQKISSRNYTQDVFIRNGATVEFTGNFNFAKNVRINVDNTSHLIVNNATLGRLNSNDPWFGIELDGYTAYYCSGGTSSAIFLNSTVKGALYGVINIKVGSGREVGTVVHIENCTFDNSCNATLYNEVHYCGLDAQIINNTFISRVNSTGTFWSNSVLLFNDFKNVQNNTFYNTIDDFGNTSLYCQNCRGNISGNSFNLNQSKFKRGLLIEDISNLYKIPLYYSLPELHVSGNTFGNCLKQIDMRGIFPSTFLEIQNNNFLASTSTATVNLVYLKGNYTKGNFQYNNHDKSTVYISNTGSLSFGFWGNTFLNSGADISGTVSGFLGGAKSGLQFACNSFNNSNNEIKINSGSTGLPDQGAFYNSAMHANKNQFSTNPLINIQNNASPFNLFFNNYASCTNPEYPCHVASVNRTSLGTVAADNSCSQSLGLAVSHDNSITGAEQTSTLGALSRFNQVITDLHSQYITPCYYQHIKDNYMNILLSPSAKTDINILNSYINSKISYYQNLPVSNELYPIKNSFQSTYIGMKRDINSLLEQDIYLRSDFDSTLSNESIKAVFREIPHPSSEYKIAEIFLKRKQFDDAIGIYNEMHNLYTLDTIDSLNAIKMAELTTLNKNLYQSNRQYKDMTASEIAVLRSIASYSNISAGKDACVILGRTFGECSPENAIYAIENVLVSPEITLSPNPSNGPVHIQISNTANVENNYILKIFNSNAQEVFMQPLMNTELENVDVDISTWDNGYYYVSLYVNDVLFTTKTLQKKPI